MGKVPVDRGIPLEGINATIKDNRVPYNLLREAINMDFPAGRTKRRKGLSIQTSRLFERPQLMRNVPNSLDQDNIESGKARSTSYKTPNSYALLLHQPKYQPTVASDWTVEFLLTLGELDDLTHEPIVRKSLYEYNGIRIDQRQKNGVFVYDQTILADDLTILSNDIAFSVNAEIGTGDTFGISSLCIGYNKDEIFAYSNFFDTIGRYYDLDIPSLSALIQYQEGKVYRVSVQYRAAAREFTLWLDGAEQARLIIPADKVFPGEDDFINKLSAPRVRDIILLNEHTVRGNYSSTCIVANDDLFNKRDANNIYAPYFNGQPDVWSCSPGRGTGLSDLRYWDSAVDINFERAFTFLDPVEEGMSSYFAFIEQGPLCYDSLDRHNRVTLHSSYGGYLVDDGLLDSTGVSLRDNQFLVKRVDADNPDIEPISRALGAIFNHAPTELSGSQSFTTQIQIRTEARKQPELTLQDPSPYDTEGAPVDKTDTRQAINTEVYTATDGAEAIQPLKNFDGGGTGEWPSHRAYDQILWTVEGKQVFRETDSNNFADRYRVSIASGAITPEGRVAFQFMAFLNIAAEGRYVRLVGKTVLEDSTVYTLTFVKRPLQVVPTAGEDPVIYGYQLEIYVDSVLDVTLSIGDPSIAGAPTSDIDAIGLRSTPGIHGGTSNVTIGAMNVDNAFDRSITSPLLGNGPPSRFSVSSRYMSPREDLVFSGVFSFFRLWGVALGPVQIARTFSQELTLIDSSSIVMNLEVQGVPGRAIPDQGPYSFNWFLGYKTWGTSKFQLVDSDPIFQYRGSWRNRDVLGWGPLSVLPELSEDIGLDESPCRGLAYYAATLTRQNGLLGNWGGFFYYDRGVSGSPVVLYSSPGLVNSFDPGHRWRGVVIADRTVLTSYSGRPLVFNGKELTPLGFDYSDMGRVFTGIEAGGNIKENLWVAIRICYYSEKENIFDIGPVSVIKPSTGNQTIVLRDIPKHPDPRVSSIMIGMSQPVDLKSIAAYTPVYFQESGFHPNQYIDELRITEDVDPLRGQIPLYVTSPPFCAYASSYNDRLWLAGDPNEPDVIYYSDLGNLQRFDVTANRLVLDRGAGDRIIGLDTAFGSLFVFKPNSIWRVAEGGPGTPPQRVQISAIGPSNEDAFVLITVPDSGKTAFLMWTTHGPYMYDEVNLQSLAFPVEGEEDPFDFMDNSSVFISHDVKRRSVQFHFKSIINGVPSKVYDGVLAYNYRYRTWGRYSGIPGSLALSVDLTRNTLSGGETVSQFSEEYFSLLGGSNGRTYKFDSSTDLDAIPIEVGQNILSIISRVGNRINVDPKDLGGNSISWDPRILTERWVTIVTQSLTEFQSYPILFNGVDFLLIDLAYKELTFDPSEGDYIYIGQPPGILEFPWDELEIPYLEKQVHRISLWAAGRFYLRFARNYKSENITDPVWNQLETDLPKRIDIDDPVPNASAVKLSLTSLDTKFALDSMMYLVDYKDHPAEND